MKKHLLAIAIACSAASAFGNPYIGANIGQADYDIGGFDDPTSWTILAGYNINEYFAAEISYTDFGEADDDITPIWTIDADAVAAALVATYPINEKFGVFAKLGAISWDATLEEQGYGEIASDDGTDLLYGFGLRYAISPAVDIVGQYLIADVDEDDISNLTIGLNYNF